MAATLMPMLACSGGTDEVAELTESSEESSGGFAGDTGSGETYGEYVAVTDDTGAIQMEVPAAWTDVNGEPWSDSGAEFASIWAAPDLNEFHNSWGTPGVEFNVTADKEKIGGHIQVLDWTRTAYEFLRDCELDSRYDYDDGYYRGAYDDYEDYNGTADTMILAAVPKQDRGDVLILLEVQIVSDADLAAADRILAMSDIVGSLP